MVRRVLWVVPVLSLIDDGRHRQVDCCRLEKPPKNTFLGPEELRTRRRRRVDFDAEGPIRVLDTFGSTSQEVFSRLRVTVAASTASRALGSLQLDDVCCIHIRRNNVIIFYLFPQAPRYSRFHDEMLVWRPLKYRENERVCRVKNSSVISISAFTSRQLVKSRRHLAY